MPMKLWRYQSGRESLDLGDYQDDAGVSTARGPLNTIDQPYPYTTPNKKHPKSVRSSCHFETMDPLSASHTSVIQGWNASPTSVVSQPHEQSVASYFREQESSNNDTLLRVQVDSSLVRTTFYVPVSLMLQREVEMQESAKQTKMSEERWSGSRLYSLWKESPQRRTGGEITLRLEPESVMKDYSDLQWKPWLTACIRSYYNSGNIRIPEECIGSDILLALEYFGILTSSPDTFIFESPQPLGRIKAWSSYFTHRMALANWIVSEYKTRLGGTRMWVTTSNPKEGDHAETLLQVNGGTGTIFGESEDASPKKIPSCQDIHQLFFDNESSNKISKETPMKMRRDFCTFLSRLFEPSKATVAFEIERVKVTKATGHVSTTLRAVLRLQVERVSHAQVLDEHARRSSAEPTSRSMPHTPISVVSKVDSALDMTRSRQASAVPRVPINQPSESYGSDSELVRVTSVQSQPIGNEMSNYSPYGYANEGDLIEAPLPSIIMGVPFEEQRHPNRSTPIPEGKRISPEEYFKGTMDSQMPRIDTPAGLPFRQHKAGSVPIGYINTAYGDLQSVTSGLSDPLMDEATFASRSNRLLLQAAKQQYIQNEIINKSSPPAEIPSDPVDHQKWDKSLRDHSTTTRPNFHPGGAFRPPPKSPEKLAPNMYPYRDPNSGGCSFWDSVVASMCEVVSQVPSQSQSSVHSKHGMPSVQSKHVMMPVTSREGFQTMNKIPMSVENPRTIHNFGHIESEFYQEYNQAYDGVYPKALANPSPAPPQRRRSDNLGSHLSHESPVIEVAKSMGQSFSNQFDDFVKFAFDVSDHKVESKTKRSRAVAAQRTPQKQPPKPVAEPLTEKVHDTPEDERQHVSEPRPVQRSSSSEKAKKSSDIIATKKSRRAVLHSAKSSMIPVSSTGTVERIELPPREPRRARVSEQKMAIARKKSTVSSYHPTNNLIIGSHTSTLGSEKPNISIAKVRVGSVSPMSSIDLAM